MKRSVMSLLVMAILAGVATANNNAEPIRIDQADLKKKVAMRLHGDRTGACLAVAVIQGEHNSTVIDCARPDKMREITADTAFEIGSVSKTFNASLFALMIEQGKLKLADPLQQHLPKSIKAPKFNGKQITLQHLLTHTSGLPSIPSSWKINAPDNPYSTLSAEDLYSALSKIELRRAPGTEFEYSNFAVMLLSDIIATRAGQEYEQLLQQYIFKPLAMHNSFVNAKPDSTMFAVGHLPGGTATSAWTFPKNTAGVGGIRASVNDITRYVQAGMGIGDPTTVALLAKTHKPISDAVRPMAMGWMIANLRGQNYLMHEGGTGGFSSFVAFNPITKIGVVILSDTALTSTGGLSSLGLHLLDQNIPLGKARRVVQPEQDFLDQLSGTYILDGGMQMVLSHRNRTLYIKPSGQPEYEMAYDSEGDFYPVLFDALLKPNANASGFAWMQGGGMVIAKRVDQTESRKVSIEELKSYEGIFELQPGFDLRIFVQADKLMAQATGQGAFELTVPTKDQATADAFSIIIRFQRDANDLLTGILFSQAGHQIKGRKK